MDKQSRQQALDSVSAEDLAKIEAHKASTKGSLPIDDEWLLLAEFAIAYGWQAYLDAKNDRLDEHGNLIVSGAEMMTLIEASRRIRARNMYENAQTSFVSDLASQSKNPVQSFNKMSKSMSKGAQADKEDV